MEISKLVEKILNEENNPDLITELTEQGTSYMYQSVVYKKGEKEKNILKNNMQKYDYLANLNPDEFVSNLVNYLFEKRSR